MRDFDQERRSRREQADHSFTIAGERFEFKAAIRPAEIVDYYDLRDGLATDLDNKAALKLLEDTVLTFLRPGQEDAWRAAMAIEDENDLINLQDLYDVIQHMIEVTSGRPTVPPTGSSDGQEATGGTTLMPVSPSPAETPTA